MYLGFNGENFFELIDKHTHELLADMLEPGQRFCLRFRQDKVDSDPLDIDKLVALHSFLEGRGKGVDVIYCANVKEPAEVAFIKLDTTIKAGINVIAVEFGNEVYSKEQANFNFETYKSWFEPLKALIKSAYPEMLCLVFLAPRPKESGVLGGRADHSRFNNAAIQYINDNPSLRPTVHIYFNSKECPVVLQRPANVAYDPEVYFEEWDTYYRTLLEQTTSNLNLWTNTINYINSSIPERGIYVTEWGYEEYGNQKNTMGTGIFAWTIWNAFLTDSRIVAMCQHNGVSKTSPGMIFPANAKDLNPEGHAMLPRIDYFIYKLFRSFNVTPGATPFYTTQSGSLSDANVMAISGKYLYSSAGATAWMSKTSKPSYEVSGLVSGSGSAVALPGINIGYFTSIPNVTPIADAGADFTVYSKTRSGTTDVVLDGSNSIDPDGRIVSYVWSNGTELLGMDFSNPKVSVPLKAGSYIFNLKVTDDKGATAEDAIIVTVKNRRRWFYWLPFRRPQI